MARNYGAVLLTRTGQKQDAIAVAVERSRVTVSNWMNGRKKPDVETARPRLLELYGIPLDAWDQDPPEAPRKARTTMTDLAPIGASSLLSTAPDVVLQRAERLGAMVDELVEQVQDDPEAVPLEKARVMGAAAQTLALLSKLLGQFDLGTRFFRLPMWREVERALERGLTGHPEAAAAVARELRRVEAESGYKRT